MKVAGLTTTNASCQAKNRDSAIIANRDLAEIRRGFTFRS
jgi:hypothetical protein